MPSAQTIYDEMRAILRASAHFDPKSRIFQLVDEAQFDYSVATGEVDMRVAAATMDLRADYRRLLLAHPDTQSEALQAYLNSSMEGFRYIDPAIDVVRKANNVAS